MTCLRFYSTSMIAGLLLLASADAVAQSNPVPSPSAAAEPQNAAPAGVAKDANPSATPAPAVSAPGTSAVAPSAVSASSASDQLLVANADKLVALAQQLKSEMDKTNQYVFSLNTVRRAGDIEKLAKELQKQLEHAKK
jgi:type VI protein secretion system component VasF